MRPIAGIAAILLGLACPLRGQDRVEPPARPAVAPAPEAPRRAGRFRVESRIVVPDGAQLLELWVPAPRVDECQSVLDCSAPAPAGTILSQQTDPENGNTFLHLRAEYPRGTIAFDATWTFERRESTRTPFRRTRLPAADPVARAHARDLAPSLLVPVDGRMKTRAGLIAPEEDDALNVARAIFDEVLRTLAHDTRGEGWGRGDVLWALDAGYGDAVDLAALFVGLARARGIPARFHAGFPLPEARGAAEAEIPRHTAWAEFYVPDLGWIPVDVAGARLRPETRQYGFGSLDERRIHFSSGRDVALAPPGKSGPRNFVIYPHAEIDGEPAPVSHRFTFKEK
jgi:transglutaminase-like putative cysteine protease